MLVAACAPTPARQTTNGSQGGQSASPSAPTRVVAVIRGTLPVLYNKIGVGATYSGLEYVERLVHSGLVDVDGTGTPQPTLAEAVPTLENGLWKVFPDGRMETTWKLRSGARWHDGTPLTAADLVFTGRVEQDKSLGWNYNLAYDAVDTVTAPDPSTVTVTWKKPFVEADRMFSPNPGTQQWGLPLPRHILERSFDEDKPKFLELPYWGPEFVGSGPFKLREMVVDDRLNLVANDDYVLGRPKIDELIVRMIPDSNTVMANFLAGELDLTVDPRALSFEEGRSLRDQWTGGRMELGLGGVVGAQAQFLTPNPAAVADVRFRRAVMRAIDRQEMADTIQGGLASVAHAFIGPEAPEWQHVQSSIVRYDFDPRRAVQELEDIGFRRGGDGLIRDSAGERPTVEIRATVTQINAKSALAMADYLQRIGLGAENLVIPLQRQSDLEYMVTFGGFLVLRGPRLGLQFLNQHSSRAATPEANFAGINRSRYRSPEYDALMDRFLVTIPFTERMQVLGQILRHETDQLPTLRLIYDPEPTMVSNRLKNVPAATPSGIEKWEVAG